MAYVKHALGKTHFTKKGRAGKTPIIWLHGGPGGVHKPDSEIYHLSDDRQVFCYTQLGSGRSSKTDKKLWNIKTFVAELDCLIKAWGLKEFHLMGGSWGTTLALEYYLAHKGKGVKSLVFQSPMFSAKDWKADGKQLIKALPTKTQHIINTCHDIGATDAAVYEAAMFEFYLKHVLRNKQKLKEMFARNNPNGAAVYEYMWGVSEFEPSGTLKTYTRLKDLGKINVPTMVICGEFDEARPETGIKYANRIKDCSFSEIKGASHSIWVEKPKKIKAVIKNFMSEVETHC